MIEQDYILRMIQDFGKLMRMILNKNTANEKVEGEFDSISNQWMGLPSSMLFSLPAQEVLRLIEDSDRMVFEKSFMMAELCRAKGLLLDCPNDQGDFFKRSLYFLSKCSGFGGNEFESEIEQRIAELQTMMDDCKKKVQPTTDGDATRFARPTAELPPDNSPVP